MEDILQTKTCDLGRKVVICTKKIKEKFKEYDLSRQFLRSGTSVGANVAESGAPHSRLSFLAKLTIARQECKETYIGLRCCKVVRIFLNPSIYILKMVSMKLWQF